VNDLHAVSGVQRRSQVIAGKKELLRGYVCKPCPQKKMTRLCLATAAGRSVAVSNQALMLTPMMTANVPAVPGVQSEFVLPALLVPQAKRMTDLVNRAADSTHRAEHDLLTASLHADIGETLRS